MEEKNIDYFLNYVKALLLKKIRTIYGITQRELAIQIDRSEISVKKYETGMLNIPFSVLFLTIHILGISKKVTEKLLEKVLEENSEKFTDDFKEECFKKMRLEIERIFENIVKEIEEDTENVELDEIKLERQIRTFLRKCKKNNKNGKKINETLITKELMSYLRFKINDFVENEVDEKFEEILEEE